VAPCCTPLRGFRRRSVQRVRRKGARFKTATRNEIRTQGELADGRPALDEIVANGASFRLKQISHDRWFMGIEAGGKHFHLNFAMSGGKLHVQLSDQGEASRSGAWSRNRYVCAGLRALHMGVGSPVLRQDDP
jgi:hypothetical protein